MRLVLGNHRAVHWEVKQNTRVCKSLSFFFAKKIAYMLLPGFVLELKLNLLTFEMIYSVYIVCCFVASVKFQLDDYFGRWFSHYFQSYFPP